MVLKAFVATIMNVFKKTLQLLKISKIDRICKNFGIKNYTINDDDSIDVNGSVSISDYISKLPLKFGNVTGSFTISSLELISLEGFPNYISGDLYIRRSNITSLNGCTQNIDGDFSFYTDLSLNSLEGGPQFVGRHYRVRNCKLQSLKGSPSIINGDFDVRNNILTSLEYGPKEVHGELIISENYITTLEHIPTCYTYIQLNYNPVKNLCDLFGRHTDTFINSLDYNYLRGNKIDRKRFNEAYSEFLDTFPSEFYDEVGIDGKIPQCIQFYEFI